MPPSATGVNQYGLIPAVSPSAFPAAHQPTQSPSSASFALSLLLLFKHLQGIPKSLIGLSRYRHQIRVITDHAQRGERRHRRNHTLVSEVLYTMTLQGSGRPTSSSACIDHSHFV